MDPLQQMASPQISDRAPQKRRDGIEEAAREVEQRPPCRTRESQLISKVLQIAGETRLHREAFECGELAAPEADRILCYGLAELAVNVPLPGWNRSEERRVGKECR